MGEQDKACYQNPSQNSAQSFLKEGVALLGVHYPLGLRTCGSFGRVEVKKEPLKKVKEWDDLDVQRPLSVTEREQKLETLNSSRYWRKVIGNKFGESPDGWHTRDLRGSYGTSLWKEIRKE